MPVMVFDAGGRASLGGGPPRVPPDWPGGGRGWGEGESWGEDEDPPPDWSPTRIWPVVVLAVMLAVVVIVAVGLVFARTGRACTWQATGVPRPHLVCVWITPGH